MAPFEGPSLVHKNFQTSLHHNYSFILCNNVQLWSHFSQPVKISGCLSKNKNVPYSCSLRSQKIGTKVPNSDMIVISTFCCCDRIPKSLVNIAEENIISLWDSGSSICLISVSLVQHHFSSLLPCLQNANSEVFTAGNHQLTVLGTLALTITFELYSALNYSIIGFDFMSVQEIFIHPELGVISTKPSLVGPIASTICQN